MSQNELPPLPVVESESPQLTQVEVVEVLPPKKKKRLRVKSKRDLIIMDAILNRPKFR